ncbi:MAG: polysaccharide pyruvyl transferase family protein [Paludibacteraceae bacterium]|nr:polysaccharide pyruvyl transferase family protein [Paludibacteraceae bacterium]
MKELGYEVYIIDLQHRPANKRSQWVLNLLKPFYAVRDYRQERFRRNFYPKMTNHYDNFEELQANPPQLDAYCIGSDQVWNPKIAGHSQMAYFLNFGDDKIKRFSYASSMGLKKWPIDDESKNLRINELLRSYIGIGVREQTLADELKRKFALDATVVCDPALLHPDYYEIIGEVKPLNEVACYVLQKFPEQLETMHVVGDLLNAPLRMIMSFMPMRGYKYTYNLDLVSWMNYLVGSKFIITDSFHGTVISIIYHKPFVVLYKENGKSSRITDLLKKVGLEDRIFFDMNDFKKNNNWKNDINWEEVDKKLSSYREKSWNYLKSTISKI